MGFFSKTKVKNNDRPAAKLAVVPKVNPTETVKSNETVTEPKLPEKESDNTTIVPELSKTDPDGTTTEARSPSNEDAIIEEDVIARDEEEAETNPVSDASDNPIVAEENVAVAQPNGSNILLDALMGVDGLCNNVFSSMNPISSDISKKGSKEDPAKPGTPPLVGRTFSGEDLAPDDTNEDMNVIAPEEKKDVALTDTINNILIPALRGVAGVTGSYKPAFSPNLIPTRSAGSYNPDAIDLFFGYFDDNSNAVDEDDDDEDDDDGEYSKLDQERKTLEAEKKKMEAQQQALEAAERAREAALQDEKSRLKAGIEELKMEEEFINNQLVQVLEEEEEELAKEQDKLEHKLKMMVKRAEEKRKKKEAVLNATKQVRISIEAEEKCFEDLVSPKSSVMKKKTKKSKKPKN